MTSFARGRLAVMGSAVALLAAGSGGFPAPPQTCEPVELFADDFSRYPPGWLSNPVMANGTLNGAIQEYHYLPHRGVPLGPWANAICYLDAWVAGDEDGRPYLEQHQVNPLAQLMSPLFVTGDPEWGDYTVEVGVRPLALGDLAGVAFRYRTNRHYYLFALSGGTEARLAVRLPLERTLRVAEWRELGRAAFPYDTTRYHRLEVENDGPRIRASVDGRLLLEATDAEIVRGKVGLVANVPARYQAFRVSACPPAREAMAERIRQREGALERLRAENPRPRLWRRFETPGFGAGRNVRFGDLDGDGRMDMLIAQNVPRVQGDAFDHISALTAVTLEGGVLWRSGRPSPRNGLLTNDTPFQIHDLDGDGRNEVVLVRDFKLQVLDGRSGRVKRSVFMPPIPADARARPYELYSGDSIVFASLTGPGRRDIVLKDRYRNFWAFSRDLEPLWQGADDTGHYPFPFDADGDGRDELFIGHARWDHTGRRRWSHEGRLKDHVDAVAVGSFGADPGAPPRVYWSSSDEGFVMLDLAGNVLKQVRVGHTQTAAVGKFRPDLPGLQYVTTNFWKSPGIMSLFDAEGNLVLQGEPIHTGSPTLPVNWRGDGQEFVLLSGSVREGGMVDGYLRRVVTFPDDGHPDLAAAVLDLTGDPRDEVVLWDQDRVWVYTQDGPAPAGRVYSPIRNPTWNDSNYRANVSLPRWVEPRSGPAPARETAGWRPLFNGKDLGGWDTWLGRPHRPIEVPGIARNDQGEYTEAVGLNKDPKDVFSVVEVDGRPAIRISGELWGAITTREEFGDYHLRFDFKWGEKRWPPRDTTVRDSGCLYHAVGPHGAGGGFWMKSFEIQVQEKDCGDFWSVAGVIVDVEAVKRDAGDPESVLAYRKGAPKVVGNRRRIIKGGDHEKPTGEWNTMEVLCLGQTSVHVVNGRTNMILTGLRHEVDGREVPLTRGRIQFQSEGAEVFYRQIEIRPIRQIPPPYLE